MNTKWQRKRQEVIARAGGTCEQCRERPGKHVHHFCYAERLGTEPLDWLQYVCLECHGNYHPHHNFKPIVPAIHRKRRHSQPRVSCRHCGGTYPAKKHRRICVKYGLHEEEETEPVTQQAKARPTSMFDWIPRP